MARVTVYSRGTCFYCMRAKSLLEQRGVAFAEIRIDGYTAEQMEELCARSKMRTVPQIFLDGKEVIGGFDDLAALDAKEGGLDRLK
ncbi:MAG: glutaredoxin domain-containing protein [Elusimicrobiota bacterium]